MPAALETKFERAHHEAQPSSNDVVPGFMLADSLH